jgi:CRP-like cAMP-binding protein
MVKNGLRGVASPPRPVTRLDAAKKLRIILPLGTNLEVLKYEFKAGETIVRQGEVSPDAFLIMEGVVEERRQLINAEPGGRTVLVRPISPVSIAYFQALVPEFAVLPARVSVVAKTSGVAYLIDRDTFTMDEQTKLLLLDAFRGQLDTIEAFCQHKPADVIPEELATNAKRVLGQKPETSWTAQSLVEAFIQKFSDAISALTAMTEQNATLRAELQKLKEDHGNLIGRFIMVRNEAEQLRSGSPLVTLQRERELMALRTLGMEIQLDSVRTLCEKSGTDPKLLELSEDAKLLLLGEEPERLKEIAEIIRRRRAPQLSDAAIDAMVAGLDKYPVAAQESHRPKFNTLPIGAKPPPQPDVRVMREPALSPPASSNMTLRPPNLVPPQAPKSVALRPPPPAEVAAPSDDESIDIEWDDPTLSAETNVTLDGSGNTVVVHDDKNARNMPGFDPNATSTMPAITDVPPVDGSKKSRVTVTPHPYVERTPRRTTLASGLFLF